MDDRELLGAYVDGRDEQAFAQLVRLHGDWVCAAAERQLRDRHLAEDATQAVFLLLVRRARGLRGRLELGGWLFRALGYCVRETRRHRSGEKRREQEVAKMRQEEIRQQADWEEISPLLDEAVGKLGKADREVVLLRFYQQKAMAEVGTALGVSEEAAKKRVQRAVGKLREKLAGKGVEVEAGSLGAMVLAHAVEGVEGGAAGLVEKVMAGIGGGGGNGTAGLIAKGAEKMMVWAKVKVAAVVVLMVAAAVGVGIAAQSTTGPVSAAPATTAPSKADEDRLEYVMGKIDQRDAALKNFEYKLTQTVRGVNLRTGATVVQGSSKTMVVRRKDDAAWVQSENDIVDGKSSYMAVIGWDGRRSRGYSQEHAAKRRLGGSIDDQESEVFTLNRFNNMLGFRALGGGRFMTFAQWVTERHEMPGGGLKARLVGMDNKQLVALSAAGHGPEIEPRGVSTYWLDPERGFMIVKFSFEDGRTIVGHTVKDCAQKDGVWVPTKVVCFTHSVGDDSGSESEYEVTDFRLNCVTDEDVKVVFPVGCEVVDLILKVSWKVTPGGIEMIPVVDPKTGQVTDARLTPMDEVLRNLGQPGATIVPATQPVMTTVPIADQGAAHEGSKSGR